MTRTVLTGSTTYYVDPVNGNDSTGTGSSGAPWQHVQYAHDWIIANVDCAGYAPTIQIVGSLITEQVLLATHPVGSHLIFIRGNPTTPSDCQWLATTAMNDSQPMVFVTDYGCIVFNGIEFGAQSGSAVPQLVAIDQHAIVDFDNTAWSGNPGGVNLYTSDFGKVNFTGPATISGDAAYFAQCQGGTVNIGSVAVSMPSALAFTAFAYASFGGKVQSTATFSGAGAGTGSTGYQAAVYYGGMVQGYATLPGTGVTGTEGFYD
jgi:hypothetical protein